MPTVPILDLAGARARAAVRDARRATTTFPRIARKPELLVRWLGGSWPAHAVLAAAVLLAGVLLPPRIDAAVERLYPDVTVQKKVLGIFPKHETRVDPRRELRKTQAQRVLRVGAGLCVLLAFWLQVPAAEDRARSAARRREERGDRRRETDPGDSARHYRAALRVTTDAGTERRLEEKIRRAEAELAPAGATAVGGEDVPAPVPTPEAPPLVAGRYRLEEELARGGMGTVHRARDTVLDRPVALKELPFARSTDDAVERFRAEARALARLVHPNVVQVHDLVEDAGRAWMAMELVEGGDLAGLVRERGALAEAEAARLLLPIAAALGAAHAEGIVHRDVKPANVLLGTDGTPKIADFGIARLAASGVTVAGTVLGSPHYMSPEQAAGETVDARSDVYSLGATFWEMLTGAPPFEGPALAVLRDQIEKDPGPPSARREGVSPAADGVVLALLAKDPGARPRDMAEVSRLLGRIAKAPAAPARAGQ